MNAPANWVRFDGSVALSELDQSARETIGALGLELAVAGLAMGIMRTIGAPDQRLPRIFAAAQRTILTDLIEFLPERITASGTIPPIPFMLGPVCRICGCSQHDPCEGGCSWVEPDLCSACKSTTVEVIAADEELPCDVQVPGPNGGWVTIRAGSKLSTLKAALDARRDGAAVQPEPARG